MHICVYLLSSDHAWTFVKLCKHAQARPVLVPKPGVAMLDGDDGDNGNNGDNADDVVYVCIHISI